MAATDGVPDGIAEPLDTDAGQGGLPTRLRLLCVGSNEPSWVSLTLQLDARGCQEPEFRWVSSPTEALTLLRDESFDCLLIREIGLTEGPGDDPLALARAVRAGGCDDPIVVVAVGVDDDAWTEALRLNVDLLVSAKGWASTALVAAIQRAVERGRMLSEIERFSAADRRRLVRERDEAEYLLSEQRQILVALERLAGEAQSGSDDRTGTDGARPAAVAGSLLKLPAAFDEYYQELVRTYVIMGSGSLGAEILKLAEILAAADLSPRVVLDLHLARVGTLVRGLGNRSSRHVMARADLLALELMIHLGECYQRRNGAVQRAAAVSPEAAPHELLPAEAAPAAQPIEAS